MPQWLETADGNGYWAATSDDAGNALYGASTTVAEPMTAPNPLPVNMDGMMQDVPAIYDPEAKSGVASRIANRLLGLNGEERFQTWPEKMVRSGGSLASDVATGVVPDLTGLRREDFTDQPAPMGIGSPVAAQPNDPMIERAQDMAGLAGGGSIAGNSKLIPVEYDPFVSVAADSGKAGASIAAIEQQAPKFYSAVEHTIDSIPQAKASGDQWLSTLANKPGVKPEEMDWLGLSDFLAGKKNVTKQELQDYVAAHKVDLQEVNKGIDIDTLNNLSKQRYNSNYSDLDINKQRNINSELEANGKQTPTKYHSYQLPGGENYREMLMTLPPTKNILESHKVIRPDGHVDSTYANAEGANARAQAIGGTVQKGETKTLNGGYKSSHWDEPNILAHVRMNDRTMPGEGFAWKNKTSGNTSQTFATKEEAQAYLKKNFPEGYNKLNLIPASRPVKSLHLEEIQSDWHQQGREKGYVQKYKPEELTPVSKDAFEYDNSNNFIQVKAPDNVFQIAKSNRPDRKIETFEDAKNYILNNKTKGNGSIPDAPFKKTWHELALKRMLREAAEKGYDRLSWTPGEVQAARYDLSKQIDSLQIHKDEKGNFKIYGKKLGNRDFEDLASDVPPEKLQDTVGKEMAQKIVDRFDNAKPYEPITELPEGWRLIHDANGKSRKEEWGVIPPGQAHAQSYTGRYLPTEKEAIKSALDRLNGEARHKYDMQNNTFENADLKIGGEGMKGFYDQIIPKALEKMTKAHGVKVQKGEVSLSTAKPTDFKDFADWEKAKAEGRKEPIHYIDIPQSLKDQAMQKGFPLFSSGLMLSPVEHDPFKSEKSK